MPSFKQNLATLPAIDHLSHLELYREGSAEMADRIDNLPGKAGSVAVYNAVADADGRMGRHAAERALELFAEHTAAAREHPGSHPNIDRLFAMLENNLTYTIRRVEKAPGAIS